MKWNKVENERMPLKPAFEAIEKDYVISAWGGDRVLCHWEIRKKGSNFPVLYGRAIDMRSAQSQASKAFKSFKHTI